MKTKIYPTKPLDCWQKAKEIRFNHYKEFLTAKEEGKLVVTGGALTPMPLIAGLGPYVFLSGEPYGASIGHETDVSQECEEAAEAKGFSRDLCSYMRNFWGSMYRDRFLFGGPFPRPDFCLQLHICDSHGKWFQVVAEHFGVPYFGIDFPVLGREERVEAKEEYLVSQMLDCIDWMQRVTGREYNDELLIEAVRNDCLSSSLWGEIMLENRNIPAPLDMKSIYSLYIIAILMRERKEAVEFNRSLLQETRDRVANGIAGLAIERCRLIEESAPPWYFLKLYRYLGNYGAVVVASYYSIFLAGNLGVGRDGYWCRALTPDERGWPLNTREDAVRALARWYLERPIMDEFYMPQDKAHHHLRIYREWKAQGMVMHFNRGCEGMTFSDPEIRLMLQEAGVPVTFYEGNMADKREFDEAQVLDRIDAFMESLGLKKLEG